LVASPCQAKEEFDFKCLFDSKESFDRNQVASIILLKCFYSSQHNAKDYLDLCNTLEYQHPH